MRKLITFMTTKAGLEVRQGTTRKERKGWRTERGALYVRAFEFSDGQKTKEIVMKVAGNEAFALSRKIQEVVKEKPEKPVGVLVHRVETDRGEITTKLGLEVFSKNDRVFVAVIVIRVEGEQKTRVNVPLSVSDALYLAEVLRVWSVEILWEEVEEVKPEEEAEFEGTEGAIEDGIPEDEDDLPF